MSITPTPGWRTARYWQRKDISSFAHDMLSSRNGPSKFRGPGIYLRLQRQGFENIEALGKIFRHRVKIRFVLNSQLPRHVHVRTDKYQKLRLTLTRGRQIISNFGLLPPRYVDAPLALNEENGSCSG
jgi:hypothetical protein